MGWPKLSQNSILEQNSVGLGFIGGEGEGNTHFPVFLRIHKEPETAGRCRNQLQEKKNHESHGDRKAPHISISLASLLLH